MSITRIQNNQITDSTIVAYAKLQAGSLTGNLFAPTVTLNSNVTINGNLFLANTGNTAIVNATNTYINDPVVVFNNGYSGSLTGYDIGMLVNRNLSPMLPYGNQVNTAWMWVEADQAFEAIATSDTGTGTTGILNLGYANIKVGNSSVTGFQTVGGTFNVTGASTLNTIVGASFQGVIGNVTPSTAAFTTQTTGGLQAVAIGNVTPGTAVFTTQTTGGLQAVAIGNVTPGTATFTTAMTGGLQAVAIGNASPGTAAFTTLTASGITQVTNSTNNNGLSYTNGALQVTGGAGFGANVYIGGNAIVAGNIVTGGNVNVVNVTGNSAQFFGNTAGFGALYAGINTGFVYQPQTVLQSSTNFNGYAQLNHQNINSGSLASSDYVATANNGSANDTYIDMGIASSTYNYAGFSIIKPNDGYLLVQGNVTTGGGNLVLTSGLNDIVFAPGGSNANNEYGRINAANVFVIRSTVAATSTTTGAITVAGGVGIQGAVYAGGLGQFSGGIQNTQIGNSVPNTAAFTTLTANGTTLGLTSATALNSTPIGNSVPSTGAFTTVNVSGSSTLNTITGASFQGVIGNVTPAAGAFTTLTTSSTTQLGLTTATALNSTPIGNSVPSTGAFTTLTSNTETVGGLQAVAIGNVTPGTAAFTTATTGGLQAVAIGNASPGTAVFTTLTASGTTQLGLTTATAVNSTPIGNSAPSTGAFTTLTASGITQVTNNTASTAYTNGALVVAGGVGIGGAVYTNSTAQVNGNITVTAGGALVTTQAAGYVFNENATTLNMGSAATTLNMGASSGTATLANPTLVGTQSTQNVYNTVATTVNAFGAATTLNLGASTGNTTINSGNTIISGNLYVVGTTTTTYINKEVINGSEVVAGILTANSTAAATNTTSGALQVAGGAGVVGALYAGSIQATPIGSTSASTGAFTTVITNGLQAVAIGNVTPGTAAFTTQTTGGLQAVAIGNVTPGTAAFTTATTGGLQAVAIGNVTPGTGAFTTLSATTFNAATIGNTGATLTGTLSTAAQTNVTSLGTLTGLTVSGSTNLQSTTATTLQAATIGNSGAILYGTLNSSSANQSNITTVGTLTGLTVSGSTNLQSTTATTVQAATIGNTGAVLTGTLSTAAQTNVTSLGTLTGLTVSGSTNLQSTTATTVQAATIGNVGAVLTGTLSTASQPNITTVGNITSLSVVGTTTSWGNIVAEATTPSTNTTTGALVVPNGGIGITGNLNVGVANSSYHQLLGNVVVGYGNGAPGQTSTFVVNQNNATPFNTTSVAHIVAKEGTAGKITLDSVGAGNFPSLMITRTARGTASAPSAVLATDTLGGFISRGYGSTGFLLGNATVSAGLVFRAAENFTDTNQGTWLELHTIPMGSNAAITALKIDAGGSSIFYNDVQINGTLYNLKPVTLQSDLSVIGTSNFANLANFDGRITISNTASTNDTTSGALVVQGGIATSGNLNAAGQLFVGTGAQTTVLTNAFTVERGTSATGPGTQYTQHAIINGTNTGSSDYIAYGNNYPGPNNDHGWMDVGFTGDAFSDPLYSITQANDGYLFASGANTSVGGNLVLATDYAGGYNDIVIGVGSFYANSEVARFHGNASNNGTLVLKLPTNATGTVSANTGALQVYGGASFGGNVYHGGAATFNGSQSSNYDFKVAGVNTTNLLWARPNSTYETVVIGNTLGTNALTNGAKLVVNSNDSMLMPAGTTGQRPSSLGYTDVAGMLRYNTSLNSLEFYNGSSWQVPSNTFTVITDQQFTATGLTASYTLSTATTTAATIVSINGVIQIPSLAYAITGGTTLTFTENPTAGDIIDVRTLSTSATIGTLSDGSGINSVQTNPALTTAGNVGLIFTTGTIGNQANQYGIDSQGGFVTLTPNVTVANAGITAVVDNLFANSYSSAEYTITSTIQGSNVREITKLLMIHNGNGSGAGTASVTVISSLCTAGNTLVTWTAGTSGNIAQLKATTANNNTIMRIKRDYQAI